MLKLPPLGLNGRDFACIFRYKLYMKDNISCLHVKDKDSELLKVYNCWRYDAICLLPYTLGFACSPSFDPRWSTESLRTEKEKLIHANQMKQEWPKRMLGQGICMRLVNWAMRKTFENSWPIIPTRSGTAATFVLLASQPYSTRYVETYEKYNWPDDGS